MPFPPCATSCFAWRGKNRMNQRVSGHGGFHWGFSQLADAERMAATLRPLTSRPEVVLLRLANCDNLDASLTYKDERRPRH